MLDYNKKPWYSWGKFNLWCFYKYNDPKKLLRYLYDHLDKDQLEIDTINFSGPRFANVDNRLMSLQLVKNGMTDAVMFGPDGKNISQLPFFTKRIF
jgi:hypothetical protein